MNGCGNDYIYVDNMDGQYSMLANPEQVAELARKLSDRSSGIGSDGLIILESPSVPQTTLSMRMFNADGSEGKMCGNGIRCVAKLAYEKFGPKESYKIATLSGTRECFVTDATKPDVFRVMVNMGRPSFLPANIPVDFDDVMVMDEEFEVADRTFRISCVSMGNPHCVIPVENLEAFDVQKYGPLIERHTAFPEGVNVEFIEVKGNKVFQRTWERGSGETLACGTGACAVGVCMILGRQIKSPVEVHLRGGVLKIEWDGLREVWMTGDAVTEKTGTFEV